MSRISYSQLSMFSECPHKWKLNYIDKLKVSEPSIHLLFGTAMHEVIQKYLNVMYEYTAKRADQLNLERTLQEKMVEQFNIDKEKMEDDFICLNSVNSTHVLNAISPAFTASFELADLIIKQSNCIGLCIYQRNFKTLQLNFWIQ